MISCNITLPIILSHKAHAEGASWIAATVGMILAGRSARKGISLMLERS